MLVYFGSNPYGFVQDKLYQMSAGMVNGIAVASDMYDEYTGPVPAGFILCPPSEAFQDGEEGYEYFYDEDGFTVLAYRIVEDKEVEEFKVMPGDWIDVRELSDDQFDNCVKAFEKAGAENRGDAIRFDDRCVLKYDARDNEVWCVKRDLNAGCLRKITFEQLTGEPLSEKKEDCPRQGDWFSHQGMSDKQYEKAVSIFSSAGANIDLDYCVTDDRHGWTHTHWDVDGDLDQVIFDSIGKGGQEWFSDWPRLSEKEGMKSDEGTKENVEQAINDLNQAFENERERRKQEQQAELEQRMSSVQSALSTQQGGTHYKDMAIQPIEFIVANNLEYRVGNVIKYACRHKNKNGAEDIRKAIHYLEMILETDYACGRLDPKDTPKDN